LQEASKYSAPKNEKDY